MNPRMVRFGMKLVKNLPNIMVAAGSAGTIVATLMAVKATTKNSEELHEVKEVVSALKESKQYIGVEPATDEILMYTRKDYNKDLLNCCGKIAVKMGKIYGPALAVQGASLVSILYGHSILNTRHIAVMAACATSEKSFKDYRKNVVDTYGEEVDAKLGGHTTEAVVDAPVLDKDGNPKTDKNGEVKTKKEKFKILDGEIDPESTYARLWDASCAMFDEESDDFNDSFIHETERVFDAMLGEYDGKMIFLNELYEHLGIEKTAAGQCVGWLYDPCHKYGGEGDNHIDLRIEKVCVALHDGYDPEYAYIINPNVDGNLLRFM